MYMYIHVPVLRPLCFFNVEERVDQLKGVYFLEMLTFLLAKRAKGKLIYRFSASYSRMFGRWGLTGGFSTNF